MTADIQGPEGRSSISVVIVTWNTRELLRACLASLTADAESGVCEVIVVDNASEDGTPEMVRRDFPFVILIANRDNVGFGRATNQGFARARGDYVLMLNSDTTVSERALPDTAAFLDEHPDVAVAGCRLVFPDGTEQNSCFRFPSLFAVLMSATYLAQLFPGSPFFNRDRYGSAVWDDVRDVDCVMGSYMMIRRRAVIEIPLLDEGYFMYGEELDLAYRLESAGWRVAYYPGVTVVHHQGGSTRAPNVVAWAYEAQHRAILRFLLKWRGMPIAYVANLIMLAGLLPRAFGWLASDLAASFFAGEGFRLASSRKLRALGFHVGAALRPALLRDSWEMDA